MQIKAPATVRRTLIQSQGAEGNICFLMTWLSMTVYPVYLCWAEMIVVPRFIVMNDDCKKVYGLLAVDVETGEEY
jgi:hypothetical protein